MKRSETIVFDTVEISNNYQTGEKWWNVRLVMVKNNAENTYPINVVFYDYNKHPIANLPYEFVASENNLYSVYSYPQRTDKSGGINEILKAYDNARFWIAYINPITNAEELVCITINIDKNYNKCDIILMFDSSGKLVQTSPEQLWN